MPCLGSPAAPVYPLSHSPREPVPAHPDSGAWVQGLSSKPQPRGARLRWAMSLNPKCSSPWVQVAPGSGHCPHWKLMPARCPRLANSSSGTTRTPSSPWPGGAENGPDVGGRGEREPCNLLCAGPQPTLSPPALRGPGRTGGQGVLWAGRSPKPVSSILRGCGAERRSAPPHPPCFQPGDTSHTLAVFSGQAARVWRGTAAQ